MPLPALVIFDMDEVLCQYDLGRRLRRLAAVAGVTARDVRAALWDSGFEGESDAGGFPDSKDYLERFSNSLGYRISVADWVAARRDAMTANEEVLSIARGISKTAPLAVYTNNGPLVKENFPKLLPEAHGIFQWHFCSYEFGTKKPDPESFTRLLKVMNRAPSECWFIDDKKSNVEGARIAGLAAHHYQSPERLRDEARTFGFDV
jgi:glucose-1-phosphatase